MLLHDPVNGQQPTIEENFAFYHRLYLEQLQILEAKLDIEAFRHGLAAFTSLRRVIITSEVHHQRLGARGIPGSAARYTIPQTQSFPRGFEFP